MKKANMKRMIWTLVTNLFWFSYNRQKRIFCPESGVNNEDKPRDSKRNIPR